MTVPEQVADEGDIVSVFDEDNDIDGIFGDSGYIEEESEAATAFKARPFGRGLPTADTMIRDILERRGWNVREGQHQMIVEVEDVIHDTNPDRGSVIDAPVGTGKSLGYLVAALSTDHRSIVCTSTKALQNQLVQSELPRLAEDLKALYDYDLTYSILKGRSNYLCMTSAEFYVSGGSPDSEDDLDLFSSMADALKPDVIKNIEGMIAKTKKAMEEDDYTSLDCDDGIQSLPRELRSEVTASRKCKNRSASWAEENPDFDEDYDDPANRYIPSTLQQVSCESICSYRKAYAGAMMTDIVVMNTSLLAAEMIKGTSLFHKMTAPLQIPQAGVIIVDEAHHLDRILTESLRMDLDFSHVYGSAEKHFRRLITRRKDREEHLENWKSFIDIAHDDIVDIIDETRKGKLLVGVSRRLLELAADLEQLHLGMENGPDVEPGKKKSIEAIFKDIEEDVTGPIREIAASMTKKMPNEKGKLEDVYDVTFSGGYDDEELVVRAVPLDLSFVRSSLTTLMSRSSDFHEVSNINFPTVEDGTLVLCSGTITDEISDTIGMTEGRYKRVPSPFDHNRSRFFVPITIPDPNSGGWFEESWAVAKESIIAAGGRTLFLTTSHRNLNMFAEAASDDPDIRRFTILRQGDGRTRQELIETFQEDESSILFGTTSFWEGIDVPGQSLSLVIMDKIMFPMRDDPIMSARRKYVEKHFPGQSFYKVDVNRAGIMMAQGAGRLIRSESDMGGVVILDPRVMEKPYGAQLMKLLPGECRVTTNQDAFREWMEFVSESRDDQDTELPDIDPRIWRAVRQKRPTRGRKK